MRVQGPVLASGFLDQLRKSNPMTSWKDCRNKEYENLRNSRVIVLEFIRGPILDRGFLEVRLGRLRDVVVVGLGSYSARVPRSSLAGVHKELVHHIMEDEVDGQDDKIVDGQPREES